MKANQALGNFLTLLKELQKIDPEFPLQYAVCLSEIALNEGLSLTDLADRTGLPLSTVSRIVGALARRRQMGEAYDLVRAEISPLERRRKALYLSSRGQAVIGQVTSLMSHMAA